MVLIQYFKEHESCIFAHFQAEEQALGRDVGGISANGQGRQRKGRGGPRDAKRMRHSSEPDYGYEDDPDLM
ncbi:hypothetical protein K7X08_016393 [Anisodus acutangulus]|uniref:Uncharacterized protein n=1 Tax=Anisodus acutangulus TaxID=402998 RepID=A0A9Q1R0S8_9SOLA|nr:hypothetical protein K7X08_016393 [Anisodus acutangulus]